MSQLTYDLRRQVPTLGSYQTFERRGRLRDHPEKMTQLKEILLRNGKRLEEQAQVVLMAIDEETAAGDISQVRHLIERRAEQSHFVVFAPCFQLPVVPNGVWLATSTNKQSPWFGSWRLFFRPEASWSEGNWTWPHNWHARAWLRLEDMAKLPTKLLDNIFVPIDRAVAPYIGWRDNEDGPGDQPPREFLTGRELLARCPWNKSFQVDIASWPLQYVPIKYLRWFVGDGKFTYTDHEGPVPLIITKEIICRDPLKRAVLQYLDAIQNTEFWSVSEVDKHNDSLHVNASILHVYRDFQVEVNPDELEWREFSVTGHWQAKVIVQEADWRNRDWDPRVGCWRWWPTCKSPTFENLYIPTGTSRWGLWDVQGPALWINMKHTPDEDVDPCPGEWRLGLQENHDSGKLQLRDLWTPSVAEEGPRNWVPPQPPWTLEEAQVRAERLWWLAVGTRDRWMTVNDHRYQERRLRSSADRQADKHERREARDLLCSWETELEDQLSGMLEDFSPELLADLRTVILEARAAIYARRSTPTPIQEPANLVEGLCLLLVKPMLRQLRHWGQTPTEATANWRLWERKKQQQEAKWQHQQACWIRWRWQDEACNGSALEQALRFAERQAASLEEVTYYKDRRWVNEVYETRIQQLVEVSE